MKRIVFAVLTAVIFANVLLGAAIRGSQYNTAKKYADPDQRPCVMYDPETGNALGFIIYADIDNTPGDEMIMAYSSKISEARREETADFNKQYLSIDVVRNEKKIRGVIEVELAYARSASPYVTVAEMFPGEAKKIFLMIYDGVNKRGRGPDTYYQLLWNGFDPKDREREKTRFETVRMPWRFILNRFNPNVPTVTEFESVTAHGYGKFYIRTLEKNAPWPQIPTKNIKALEEEVRKYQSHIFWEYAH
ncbi:MAG TPA: hypothetical protein ENN43_08885 [bacterium]|nr:hypothetical protein [bacterium]